MESLSPVHHPHLAANIALSGLCVLVRGIQTMTVMFLGIVRYSNTWVRGQKASFSEWISDIANDANARTDPTLLALANCSNR